MKSVRRFLAPGADQAHQTGMNLSTFSVSTQNRAKRAQVRNETQKRAPGPCEDTVLFLHLLQVQNRTHSSDLPADTATGPSHQKQSPDLVIWFCPLQRLLTKLLSHPKILKSMNQPRVPDGTHVPTRGSLSPPEPLITLTPHPPPGNRGEGSLPK